ncbi:MAG: molybdopterin-dependent oxidoreductase [Actinobacteria bacterium]|nr:molybdopterin-dependent oxidoreductase [Actinomycetota bacterium]
MDNVAFLVVQDTHQVMEDRADVMLPAAPAIEKDGHFTDWEGRGQRLRAVRGPKRLARPDWELFVELAKAMGHDLGFSNLDELHEQMGSLLRPRGSSVPAGSADATSAGDDLTLVTYPLLVDEGSLSEEADELKAALAREPFVEVNSEDAASLKISDGDTVRVKTAAGAASLPAVVTDGIARGVVFVPFNQDGFAANTLLSGACVTSATLEGGA